MNGQRGGGDLHHPKILSNFGGNFFAFVLSALIGNSQEFKTFEFI
jgi:hypothetical protein